MTLGGNTPLFRLRMRAGNMFTYPNGNYKYPQGYISNGTIGTGGVELLKNASGHGIGPVGRITPPPSSMLEGGSPFFRTENTTLGCSFIVDTEKIGMDFEIWEKYYLEIVANFGFDSQEDARAAQILAQLSKDSRLLENRKIDELLRGKKVYVFGGGPSVNEQIKAYDFDGVTISADAATSALVEVGMEPDIIVTDLDGNVNEQVELNGRGAIVFIHAHGDNIVALEHWVKEFKGPMVPTCQTVPSPPLQNFGGFTDGDRAIFLADHFEAASIQLVGFDFAGEGSAYKKMDEKKVRKLVWAQLLIAMLDNPAIQFIDEDRPMLYF